MTAADDDAEQMWRRTKHASLMRWDMDQIQLALEDGRAQLECSLLLLLLLLLIIIGSVAALVGVW